MDNKFLDILLETKELKNSLYSILKHRFLYNSNKIEGSTFTTEALALLLDKNVVTGKHTLDDVQETLDDIVEFHYRFELIHPFQDRNGRIGRFLMLKQMIENNLPIKIVSWDTEDLYRNSLKLSSIGNYSPLSTYLKTLPDFREEYKEFWENV